MTGTATRERRRRTGLRYTAAAVAFGLLMTSGASASTSTVGAQPAGAAAGAYPDPAGGGSPLFLELPPVTPDVLAADRIRQTGAGQDGPVGPGSGNLPRVRGIPATVLAAYQRAADRLGIERPSCGVPVPLLAAIGRVESNHARGGYLDSTGRARTPIIGPQLNGGPGVAAIRDTDGGRLDGDRVYDRAVGPMQFIPSTWARWGADGNGDRAADPQNVFDSTLAAARYLCAAGGDLTVTSGLHRAIRAYNRPDYYLRAVLAWMRVYSGGTIEVPDATSAGGSEEPAAREDDSTGEAPPPRDEPESEPEGDTPPAREEPGVELAVPGPAGDGDGDGDGDSDERSDPVEDAAELTEPIEEAAGEVLDGEAPDPPALPGTH